MNDGGLYWLSSPIKLEEYSLINRKARDPRPSAGICAFQLKRRNPKKRRFCYSRQQHKKILVYTQNQNLLVQLHFSAGNLRLSHYLKVDAKCIEITNSFIQLSFSLILNGSGILPYLLETDIPRKHKTDNSCALFNVIRFHL